LFRVLVVDDANSIVVFMSRLLKNKFDCEVFSAENGLIALSILEDEDIDIIFLDVTMPIMDGVETLRAIRESEFLKNIPVIILSSIADKETVDELNDLKIHNYMLKPLNYDSAYKAIRKIFDKINLERKNADSFDTLIEQETEGRKKIVLIDQNEDFKEKFRLKLANDFIIFDSESGPKGLNIILKEKPDYIFVAENLQILSEYFIAKKIKSLTEQSELIHNPDSRFNFDGTQIYLIKDIDNIRDMESELLQISEEEKELFDEVFIKSDEPDILLRGLSKALKF